MRERRVVTIEVYGEKSYERWTLEQWVLYVKELLEEEYCVEIRVAVVDEPGGPGARIGDLVVVEGVPGEEGYLVELLKKALETVLGEEYVEECRGGGEDR